jgi:hypothetical protein
VSKSSIVFSILTLIAVIAAVFLIEIKIRDTLVLGALVGTSIGVTVMQWVISVQSRHSFLRVIPCLHHRSESAIGPIVG